MNARGTELRPARRMRSPYLCFARLLALSIPHSPRDRQDPDRTMTSATPRRGMSGCLSPVHLRRASRTRAVLRPGLYARKGPVMSKNLYVGNLSFEATEADLTQAF